MAVVGYKRVSSESQNPDRQLASFELDKEFLDRASGKDLERPQLVAALDYIREGDLFLVHSMDRLARNVGDLLNLIDQITKKGVTVKLVQEGLTFTGEDSSLDKLLLSMLGAVAEFERSLMLERQREGIEIAKKAGKYKGGKPKLTAEQVAELKTRRANGESPTALAKEFRVSRATIYNVTTAR